MPTLHRSHLFSIALFAIGAVPLQASGVSVDDDFSGSWSGEVLLPFDSQPMPIRFGIEQSEDGLWRGAFEAEMFGPGLMEGKLKDGALELECDMGGSQSPFSLKPADKGGLKGMFRYRGFPIAIEFERFADSWVDDLRIEVDLPDERPERVTLEGLPDFWLEDMQPRVDDLMNRASIVGLAMAIVVDGELLDVRSWGWKDVASRQALDGDTLFRWASISKTVTGIVATKLAVADELDLDADVRVLVPEFPEKKHVVSTRLLLGHLGGIAHYQHMPKVTREDYDVVFPFRDPVRAIDMFKAAPLINEPGTEYSYSTHGFALAGAVLERSSERGFKGEVKRMIAEPLGMTTFEPDDPTARRSNRTTGYRITSDGRIFESGDTDISWKLAGGGFQSSVADMARYAVGLCDEEFLSEEERDLLWTSGRTREGKSTGYGLGFSVGRVDGRLEVSHGGAQRRTATYLIAYPDERIAIALMCNTEGVRLEGLARNMMQVIFAEE